MWDLEFTERKPLDDSIQDELTGSGDKAFRTLYRCLLAHAADQQQSAGRDGAAEVKLTQYTDTISSAPGSTHGRIILFSSFKCLFINC